MSGEARLLADVFLGGEADLVAGIDAALRAGGATDQKLAVRLAALDLARPSVAILAELEGMFSYRGIMQPIQINGVDPAQEQQVSIIGQHMVQGRLDDLRPGEFGVIIGEVTAGMDVVDAIAAMPNSGQNTGNRALEPLPMTKVTVANP